MPDMYLEAQRLAAHRTPFLRSGPGTPSIVRDVGFRVSSNMKLFRDRKTHGAHEVCMGRAWFLYGAPFKATCKRRKHEPLSFSVSPSS